MSMLFILIPLSIILIACALWGFFWAVRAGQFDDLETPSLSILSDDQAIKNATHSKQKGLKKE